MLRLVKPAIFAAVIVTGAATVARAQTTTLPEVVVRSNLNPHHYVVPSGYDADTALHPYTSGIGPCLEGATPDTGCWRPTRRIMPSHYERPPFNQP